MTKGVFKQFIENQTISQLRAELEHVKGERDFWRESALHLKRQIEGEGGELNIFFTDQVDKPIRAVTIDEAQRIYAEGYERGLDEMQSDIDGYFMPFWKTQWRIDALCNWIAGGAFAVQPLPRETAERAAADLIAEMGKADIATAKLIAHIESQAAEAGQEPPPLAGLDMRAVKAIYDATKAYAAGQITGDELRAVFIDMNPRLQEANDFRLPHISARKTDPVKALAGRWGVELQTETGAEWLQIQRMMIAQLKREAQSNTLIYPRSELLVHLEKQNKIGGKRRGSTSAKTQWLRNAARWHRERYQNHVTKRFVTNESENDGKLLTEG